MATTESSASVAHPKGLCSSTSEPAEERRFLLALEESYRNELMGEEERLELRDRILGLRRKLESATETVDAHYSGLESPAISSDL